MYVFTTELLSSRKTGNPNSITDSISSSGVSIVNLIDNHCGLAFNPKSTLNSVLTSVVIEGSEFRIDSSYNTSVFALLKNDGYHTTFFYNSASILQNDFVDSTISTPTIRRKRYLGYNAGSMYRRDSVYITMKQTDGTVMRSPESEFLANKIIY